MCVIEGCDNPIYVKSTGVCSLHYARYRKYGSYEPTHRSRLPMEERFWRKVNKTEGCWLWTDKPNAYGYGLINEFGKNGKRWFAHRYSWFLHNGEIPKSNNYHGTVVRHKCDNRLCVNPDHLELGTQKDNVRDMDARGRRVSNPKSGSDHWKRKRTHCAKGHELTDDNIRINSKGGNECLSCYKARRKREADARKAAFKSKPKVEKTHCPNGHEFTDENSYTRPDGYKECRTCRVERMARFKRKQK
jgi:hypothetical protein